MSSVSLPRVGAACLVLLLLASGLPVQAAHGDDLHVTGVTPGPFAADGVGHTVAFTVTNGGTTSWDKITLSAAATTEIIAVTGAAATGWTASTARDTDDPAVAGDEDTIDLTGSTLAAGASIGVTLTFDSKEAGTAVVTVTGDLIATPAPKSDTFSLVLVAADMVVSKTTLALAEPATADTFTVKLAARPTGPVEVGFTVPATHATVKATASEATKLTFTSTTWNTAQSVTVTPVNDYKDTADRTATLTVQVLDASSSAEYDLVADKSLAITITDNDAPGIVVKQVDAASVPAVDDSRTIVYEGGPVDRLAIHLATLPNADTKLSITLDTVGAAQVSLDKTELTFTPANGRTPQLVTFTAKDDTVVEALAMAFTITVARVAGSSSTEYSAVTAQVVTGSVIDNEGVGFTVVQTDGETVVSEAPGATTDRFSVVLDRQPHASVVIKTTTVQTGQTEPEISVLPSPLLFTTSNWNQPQDVVVTALQDQRPEPTEVATITLAIDKATSSGEYHGVAPQIVTVSITDDDAAGFAVVETAGATITTEPGGVDTVSVALTKEPASNVVIKVLSTDTDEVTATTTPAGGLLTFTPTTWSTAQTVTLTGVDDTLADGHQVVDVEFSVVSASSDPNWRELPTQIVKVTNKDNEAVVMAMPSTLPVLEGESSTYELSLTIKPTNDVTVTVTPGGGLTTDPTSVVFTPTNWQTAQTITVTVPDDASADGPRTVTIAHDVTSQGAYANAPGQSVTVAVEDDDKIDIAAQNKALQKTVKVTRSDERNTITWDISVVEDSPAGVQIWRADSPFFILANVADGTANYRAGSYTDNGGETTSRYVVTVYYGATEELGFFEQGRSVLTQVQGYTSETTASLEDIGASVPDEDNTALIAGVVLGLLVLVAIVVAVILIARRKRGDEETFEADWETPGTEPVWDQPAADGDAWSEEPVTVEEPQWDTTDAGWSDDSGEAWPEDAEASQAWPEHVDEPLATFHLTCPRCQHDFSVQGHKPLETECPNCGVTGTLR